MVSVGSTTCFILSRKIMFSNVSSNDNKEHNSTVYIPVSQIFFIWQLNIEAFFLFFWNVFFLLNLLQEIMHVDSCFLSALMASTGISWALAAFPFLSAGIAFLASILYGLLQFSVGWFIYIFKWLYPYIYNYLWNFYAYIFKNRNSFVKIFFQW